MSGFMKLNLDEFAALHWLGRQGHQSTTGAAAVVSAVVGGKPAALAFETAQQTFCAIDFSQLTVEDFKYSGLGNLTSGTRRESELPLRTTPRRLGSVDVFLSHSGHDPGANKVCHYQRAKYKV